MTALWGEYLKPEIPKEEVLSAESIKLFIMNAMQQDPYRVPLPRPRAQDDPGEVDLMSSETFGLEMDDTVIHTIKLMQHSSEMTQLIEAAKEQTELMVDSQINTFPPALSIPHVPERKPKCRLNYPIPHLNKEFSDFTLGRGPKVPDVTFKTAKKLLKKSVAALLAHAGYHTTKESVLNTFSDIVEEYIKKMTMLLRVAVDQGANVMATGFPDAMERVFHDMNIGSLRCIHKYYQNRVIKYHEKLLEECKLLNWEYNNISIPMKTEVLSLETIAFHQIRTYFSCLSYFALNLGMTPDVSPTSLLLASSVDVALTEQIVTSGVIPKFNAKKMEQDDVPEIHFPSLGEGEGVDALQPSLEPGFQMLHSLELGTHLKNVGHRDGDCVPVNDLTAQGVPPDNSHFPSKRRRRL